MPHHHQLHNDSIVALSFCFINSIQAIILNRFSFHIFFFLTSHLHLNHKMQYWMLSKAGEIRRDEACLDYSGNDVVLYPCHGSKGNQVSVHLHIFSTVIHCHQTNNTHFHSLPISSGHTIQMRSKSDMVRRRNAWLSSNRKIKS